jgi:hypothetical protein
MGGERPATVKRQSCYTMPESSLQYAVPLARKREGLKYRSAVKSTGFTSCCFLSNRMMPTLIWSQMHV